MSGYNFTERVRKVLAIAREEAVRLSHEYVGTEHILLGLVREGEGVAAAVLESFDVDPDRIIAAIDSLVKKGRPSSHPGPDLPYTSRAKKVIELAMTEARDLNHSYVGTEHLMLGLIREEKGIAAQVLLNEGITLAGARTEILRLLGTDVPPRDRDAKREVRVTSVAMGVGDAERAQRPSPRRAKFLPLADWATDRARVVIGRARAAAANRHSRDIEPEHLLIALLQEESGMAMTILAHLQVDRTALARAALGAVEETLATDEPFELELSYSDSTESALRHAFHAARLGRERRVGTDHLLEGLLLEVNTPAARLLADAGLTVDAIREERARIVG